MSEVTRRRLLSTAAAGAGGMLASSMLPPALARAAAEGPRRGSLKDVKHVVVHMQENRSFDHYFGTLGGVRGFGDPNVQIQHNSFPTNGKSVFYQYDPQDPNPPADYLLPWHLDTRTTSAQAIPSTSHAWTVQHQAINITVGNPTTAGNDMWLPAHLAADGATNGLYTMSYYERQGIPFHFALAETFTLCDAYHCSLLGPTWPNRMYLMTGMIDPGGTGGGPVTTNVVPSPFTGKPYTWTTYPERLTQAGISWRVYQEEDDYGTNPLEWFANYQNATPGSPLYENALTIYPPDRFEWDARNDRLPTVSWILPTSGQSEHPAYLPASGANFLASKLNAVAENRDLWSKTVFIVNYDENDGLFDHVARAPERLHNPHGVSVTPGGTEAYVTDSERDQVVVIDTTDLRTTNRIPVGSTPWNTAFSADGSSAYVTNANDDTVSVIDTASQTVTSTIPLGSGTTTNPSGATKGTMFQQLNHQPTAIGLGPNGDIWVGCNTSSSLAVISTSTNSVIDSTDIGLGFDPTGIAFI